MFTALATLLVAWLPGALMMRLPTAGRDRRARLAVEERLFWAVILSVAWSLSIALALAAAGAYSLERLLTANALLCVALAIGSLGRLRFGAGAARPTWTVLLPVVLVALGLWRFFPPAEYLIGGKDPGTYMNEGFQIAKRGAFVVHDETVAAVPASLVDLFFTPHPTTVYYDNRFMGFFLRDPATGATVGQLPHLYPASIAVAYGIGGLDAALRTTGLWAVLAVLAVFVAGSQAIGRAPAFGAAVLLALSVMQVWWSRYPNAEIAMQALAFAALTAFARARESDDAFFAGVAGWLVALLPFVRIETIFVIGAILAALALQWIVDRRRPPLLLAAPIAIGGALALWYHAGPLALYFERPLSFLEYLPGAQVIGGGAGIAIAGALLVVAARRAPDAARRGAPIALIVAVLALAAYAWFLREPGGRLTDFNAYALRTYTDVYFSRPVLIAALLGFAVVVWRRFWHLPALAIAAAGFAVFFCYKIRIVEEHFWMSRRMLPIVLPGLLLFAGAAALGRVWGGGALRATAIRAAGGALLVFVGLQYAAAARPLLDHVDTPVYEDLDALAAQIDDRDLVIVESRDAGSDNHVFATPLAYLYGKHVLVLESAVPNTQVLEAFLADALDRYGRVLFLGGGGTTLLSRRIAATPIADARVKVPEYEVTSWQTVPDEVRRKDFDYTLYELSIADERTGPFTLDIGFQDDLHVVRFHAKEETEGRTIRWTGPQSFIFVPGLTGTETTLSLIMHDGGRPKSAVPASVSIWLDDDPIGTIQVGSGFQRYTLALPADAVRRAAARDAPARLILRSTVWVPQQVLGGTDTRELGVMIDRVEIR